MNISGIRGYCGVTWDAKNKKNNNKISFKANILTDTTVFYGDVSSLKGFIPKFKQFFNSVMNFLGLSSQEQNGKNDSNTVSGIYIIKIS